MRQQYLALLVLAILAVASGCTLPGQQPQATAIPYDHLSAQDVFNAFAKAGLQMQNPQEDTTIAGRGAPTQFKDRYTFEVPDIAPAGGQVIVFSSPDEAQAWQNYITQLRSSTDTRRDVVYVYFTANLMLQLDTGLTNAEAGNYRDAFMALK